MTTETVSERLARRSVTTDDGCTEWQGFRDRHGYGRTTGLDGQQRFAHRVAYELHVGPIPDGMVIDHLCRNRACVNPAHMECVTPQENNRRGEHRNRRKTHCSRGHEFTPENTYYRVERNERECKTCQQARRQAVSS